MLRKESWVAGFLFLCGGFGVKRCGGSVVAVRVWQGACRPLTDATLWRAGALRVLLLATKDWHTLFHKVAPLDAAGGLCKELTFLRLWQGISNS